MLIKSGGWSAKSARRYCTQSGAYREGRYSGQSRFTEYSVISSGQGDRLFNSVIREVLGVFPAPWPGSPGRRRGAPERAWDPRHQQRRTAGARKDGPCRGGPSFCNPNHRAMIRIGSNKANPIELPQRPDPSCYLFTRRISRKVERELILGVLKLRWRSEGRRRQAGEPDQHPAVRAMPSEHLDRSGGR